MTQVDFEVKAFTIVSIFAILKVFSLTSSNTLFLQFSRGVFLLSHIFIIITLFKNILKVDHIVTTKEKKQEIRVKLRKSLGSILLRAIIIALIHWKTSMLQPLFVSSTLGLFTIIELDDHSNNTVTPSRKKD